MDRLPSNIMFHIFSKVPVKCLALSRCVSKVWCEYIDDRYLMSVYDERVIEEPIPILYHTHLNHKGITRSLCFHIIESKETETGTTDQTYVLEPKADPFLEFLRKAPLKISSDVQIEVRRACNGLICLSQSQAFTVTTLVVVHPLRKECYELPPLPTRFYSSIFEESCGLGYDASTNTLKMVCVLPKDHAALSKDPDMVRKNICTIVHEIGTNSWREIPQVPPYHVTDGAVFANGCLHWLVSQKDILTEDGGRPVIWFDVEKEEFGLIDPPKRMCDLWRDHYRCVFDHLVDINGEVGFVCAGTMEIWVLKQKEWVPYCRPEKTIVPDGYIEVLGCWNKDGDLLIRNLCSRYEFFIYNLKSGVLHKTLVFPDNVRDLNIFMHPNKLFSIRGIGTNSFPLRKVNLKRSCQRLLSCY